MSFIAWLKGALGESAIAVAQHLYLDRRLYRSLNNLTLQTSNGTTQIDHVVVSRFGIFVVETKNIDGWIFGDERAPTWTVVKHRRRWTMQNPLRQNYRHIKALGEFLGLGDDAFHSVVVFIGDGEFKTPMPPNVLRRGYATYVKSFTDERFSEAEVDTMAESLRSGALPKGRSTRRAHLASLAQRHESRDRCPKCGASLTIRTSRSGASAGTRFYGCSAFPSCRYTANLDDGGARP